MFRKLLAAALCACLLFAGAVNLEGLSARADGGDLFERVENLLREKSAEADVSMAEVNGGETEETSVEEATRAYQAMQDEMFDLPEPAQDDQVYASASGVDYSIWGTSVKITLPSGSYKYSSSSTMVIYYCPTISKVIGFGRSSYASLSTWKTVLTADGYTTGYETINGISTVYGLKYESSSYYVEYYYNYGGYSYCVMMVQASYSEAEYFISNVMSTLRSGSTATATPKPTATPTPKPTATPTPSTSEVRYNIWDSGVYLTLPKGSYQYSKESTVLSWLCTQQDLLIAFARSIEPGLSSWENVFEEEGCTTGYEDVNDISTVWGMKADDDGYTVAYAFDHGSYSYLIMVSSVTYDQAEYFIDKIISTLSASKVAPTPYPWMVLPESLKRIEDEAFKGSSVVAVWLPDGCESIGARAFANCKNLEDIHIPASVNSIADDAFEGCGEVSFSVEDMDTYAVEYADQHGIDWAMG